MQYMKYPKQISWIENKNKMNFLFLSLLFLSLSSFLFLFSFYFFTLFLFEELHKQNEIIKIRIKTKRFSLSLSLGPNEVPSSFSSLGQRVCWTLLSFFFLCFYFLPTQLNPEWKPSSSTCLFLLFVLGFHHHASETEARQHLFNAILPLVFCPLIFDGTMVEMARDPSDRRSWQTVLKS